MNRRDFGTWGLDLPTGEFARALAAAGVRAGLARSARDADLVSIVREAHNRRVPLKWKLPSSSALRGIYAKSAATDWPKALVAPVRLEIEQGVESPPWLVGVLGDDSVAAAIYVRGETSDPHRAWHWPLRVSVPRGASLRQAIESSYWNKKLYDVADVEAGAGQCDVLILPSSVRAALAYLLDLHRPVRASCVILTEGLGTTWGRTRALISSLRTETRAAAVVVLRVRAENLQAWWHFTIEELAHNNTIDTALAEASRKTKSTFPLILASRQFIASTQLERVASAMGARLERSRAVEVYDLGPVRLPVTRGTPSEIGRMLRHAAPSLGYEAESDAASAVAAVARDGPTAAAARAPREPERRRAQVVVLDLTEGESRVDRLQPERSYGVDFKIALPEARAVIASAAIPELPPSETGHDLVVVFSDPRLAPDPQVASLHLPPEGPSDTVRFFLQTSTAEVAVQARIIVLFGNRVLQTLLFRARIGPDAPAFTLESEATVRADLADLDERTRYDAAMVFNHTDGGEEGVTLVAGGSADLEFPVDMRAGADVIRDKLTEFATRKRPIEGGLRGEDMRQLLVFLAAQGAALYEPFIRDELGDKLKEAIRVHVLTARPESFVPVELLYDRPAPVKEAQLCGGAEEALEKGKCPSTCAKLTGSSAPVVCPLGFWALNRVIERHAHVPEKKPAEDVALAWGADPSPGREMLSIAGSLFTASARVDREVAGSTKKVLDALGPDGPPVIANTWPEWCDGIKAGQPGLLVLLPHTFDDETLNLPSLEIAQAEHLVLTEIDDKHVSSDPTKPGPLVLLLGCDTGTQMIQYQNFVVRMRKHGAAIVVGTIASVLGRNAAPTAAAIVEALREQRARGDATFGEVMLAVRRKLLRDAVVMVLALSSYGDADWRLH